MELIPSSDGPWGGESVFDEFIRFLGELVGENAMAQWKENDLEDYVELCRYFEDRFKWVPLHTDRKTNVSLPQSYLYYGKTINHVKEFKDLIKKSNYKDTIELSSGKLSLPNPLIKFFLKKNY